MEPVLVDSWITSHRAAGDEWCVLKDEYADLEQRGFADLSSSPQRIERVAEELSALTEQMLTVAPDPQAKQVTADLINASDAIFDAFASGGYNPLDIEYGSIDFSKTSDSLETDLNSTSMRLCGRPWTAGVPDLGDPEEIVSVLGSQTLREVLSASLAEFGFPPAIAECVTAWLAPEDAVQPQELGVELLIEFVVRFADDCSVTAGDIYWVLMQASPSGWEKSFRELVTEDIGDDPRAASCAAEHLGGAFQVDTTEAVTAMSQCGLPIEGIDWLLFVADRMLASLFGHTNAGAVSNAERECLVGRVDGVLDATIDNPDALLEAADACFPIEAFLI